MHVICIDAPIAPIGAGLLHTSYSFHVLRHHWALPAWLGLAVRSRFFPMSFLDGITTDVSRQRKWISRLKPHLLCLYRSCGRCLLQRHAVYLWRLHLELPSLGRELHISARCAALLVVLVSDGQGSSSHQRLHRSFVDRPVARRSDSPARMKGVGDDTTSDTKYCVFPVSDIFRIMAYEQAW
jgi:hypothetical protein